MAMSKRRTCTNSPHSGPTTTHQLPGKPVYCAPHRDLVKLIMKWQRPNSHCKYKDEDKPPGVLLQSEIVVGV